ncbi:MAG: hypothetical protein RRY08_07085, partial [Christensenella sp.]
MNKTAKTTEMSDEAQLYCEIVQQSTDGVYVLGKGSYTLLYANDAMQKIFENVGIHDYQGQKCYSALRNQKEPCENCFACSAACTAEPREVYLNSLSKYYLAAARAIKWQGTPAYVIYLSDISDGKKSRYELAKTQEKLAAAIDHAGLAYWEYDIANSRAYLNAISTTEYTLDEIINNYPAALYETGAIHPDSIAAYDSLIQGVKSG